MANTQQTKSGNNPGSQDNRKSRKNLHVSSDLPKLPTAEREAELEKQLATRRYSRAEHSKRAYLNPIEKSLQGKLKRRNKLTPTIGARIVGYRHEGMSFPRIAKKLGIHRMTIYQWMREENEIREEAERAYNEWLEAEIEEIPLKTDAEWQYVPRAVETAALRLRGVAQSSHERWRLAESKMPDAYGKRAESDVDRVVMNVTIAQPDPAADGNDGEWADTDEGREARRAADQWAKMRNVTP